MKDENNPAQTVCTLSKVEKLRIALDVARGMKHIAERKVSENVMSSVEKQCQVAIKLTLKMTSVLIVANSKVFPHTDNHTRQAIESTVK